MNELQKADVATAWAEDGWELPPADLLIDAMSDPVPDLIQLSNSHQAPVLSAGLPTGIDPDTGSYDQSPIRAAASAALGFPFAGLTNKESSGFCGNIYLVDIGIPNELYSQYGIDKRRLFLNAPIISLDRCAR